MGSRAAAPSSAGVLITEDFSQTPLWWHLTLPLLQPYGKKYHPGLLSVPNRSQTPSTMEEKGEDIQENRNGPKGFISASSKCCTGVRQVRLQMSTQITPRQHEHQYRLMSRKYILSSSVLSHFGQFIHCVSSASAGHNSLLSCCVWSFGRCQ